MQNVPYHRLAIAAAMASLAQRTPYQLAQADASGADSAAVKAAIENLGSSLTDFRRRAGETLAEYKARIEDLESRLSQPVASATGPRRDIRETAEYKALDTYLRTGQLPPDLEGKAMSIGGGASAGGALVPEVIANEIFAQAVAGSRIGEIVRNTRSDTADYVRLINLRGQASGWVSETGSRSATAQMKFREIRPTHGELYSIVTATNWLMKDSKFSVVDLVTEGARTEFARQIAAAIISGSGSNQPTGILHTTPVLTADFASPARAADAIQYVNGTSDLADDLVSLFFSLAPEYRVNATFVMSSYTLATVRKLRADGGSGQYLWQQNMSASIDAPDGLLLGRPVITCEDMPAYAASPTNFSVLCGDFNQGYELVRIGDFAILPNPYTTPGQTTFYLSQRAGGRVADNNAIKALKH